MWLCPRIMASLDKLRKDQAALQLILKLDRTNFNTLERKTIKSSPHQQKYTVSKITRHENTCEEEECNPLTGEKLGKRRRQMAKMMESVDKDIKISSIITVYVFKYWKGNEHNEKKIEDKTKKI